MYCVNCGKKVEDGANFCVNCGTDMRNYKTSEEKVPCENDRIKQKRRNSRNGRNSEEYWRRDEEKAET